MKCATLTLAALLLAGTVSAAPITLGTWRDAPVASNSADTPYSNRSADGEFANAGYVLGLGPGWEYLTGAPWTFPYADGVLWTEVYGWTAFTNRAISQTPAGAFDYRNLDTGDHYQSNGTGWMQFVLLRRQLDPLTTAYLVAIEDMGLGVLYPGMGPSDFDYNDLVFAAVERRAPGGEIDPRSGDVPEPASLALFGLSALACARRLTRKGRS